MSDLANFAVIYSWFAVFYMRFCSQQSAAKRVFLTLSWCFLPMGPPPKTFRAKHGAGGFNGKAGLWKKSTAPVFPGDLWKHTSAVFTVDGWRFSRKSYYLMETGETPRKTSQRWMIGNVRKYSYLHCCHQIVLNLPSCVVEYSIWKCVCIYCTYCNIHMHLILTSGTSLFGAPITSRATHPEKKTQKHNISIHGYPVFWGDAKLPEFNQVNVTRCCFPTTPDGGKSGGGYVTRTQRWSQMTSNVWGSRGHVLNHLEVYIYIFVQIDLGFRQMITLITVIVTVVYFDSYIWTN